MHLRSRRPEGLHCGPDRRHARGAWRHGVHGGRQRAGIRSRPLQVPGSLWRLRHRPALAGARRRRPPRLRRPVQAGRGLSTGLIAPATPARAYPLTVILNHPLNAPVPVEEQVVAIYAGSNGFVDDIPVTAVQRFERELIAYLRGDESGVLEQIRDKGELPDEETLNKAIADFKEGFDPGAGGETTDGGDRSTAVGGAGQDGAGAGADAAAPAAGSEQAAGR